LQRGLGRCDKRQKKPTPADERPLAPTIPTCYNSTIDFELDFIAAAIAAAERPLWTSRYLTCRCSNGH
jgi:hypothetical protein